MLTLKPNLKSSVKALPLLAPLFAPLFALCLFHAAAAHAETDRVVARVGGQEIHLSEVTQELANLPPQVQQLPLDKIYPQLLEEMIDAKLLIAQAHADKLEDSPEFKERIASLQQRVLTELELKNKVKPMLTDEALKAEYDKLVAAQKKPAGDEVRARHILVKTEKEAQEILAQLAKGGDFAKIAAAKSADQGSAKQGGDLGFFTRDQMVPAFAEAAFAMKVGETSKAPVKTDFGYHIIKIEDRRKASPPPAPPAFDKVKPELENFVGKRLAAEYLETLKKGAKIERFNRDGSPLKEEKTQDTQAPTTTLK